MAAARPEGPRPGTLRNSLSAADVSPREKRLPPAPDCGIEGPAQALARIQRKVVARGRRRGARAVRQGDGAEDGEEGPWEKAAAAHARRD